MREQVSDSMSAQISLTLLPSARCLFDEPVQVKVAGLRSNQLVTLRARSTDERGVVFNSSASYRADGSGEIDLNRDASLSGSYVGVEPMGLLRSLKADTSHKYFYKDKALEPFMVNFSVHEEEEGGILAEATNERRLIGDGVMRVPVEVGNIQGVLFTPPGEGPFPAVLDLGTLMSEKRASLLANKGFIVLALPIFIGKPKLERMNLDDFEEAVKFLQNQPKVGSKGVGVISQSKGADIALSLAAFVPGVEAVVWINGCSASAVLPLYYKNRQILSALKFDMNKVISTQSGAFIIKYAMHDSLKEENKASLVPIERASGQFLFVASEDDFNWDSKAYMDEMVDRLKRHGKENFESVSYPEAGHYLEPPFGPYCHSSFHGFVGIPVLWGGEPRAHAAAEVHLWSKIQEFFRTHLDCDKTETKSKL
ncbi:acyl-coenzyme A thioesterase 2, mitochondrial-like isoform X1 [Xiphophorus couchianus]|uniref:acyl-coenzyme A thioesterase 2, mitochondrial-like isoform X1 n=1 Tax=Xiphophorus couchianus TaxID=32473 RepID=UPI001015F1C0|nr:acyl-coenzyme A thioesterase 2, mitochondrial-like isoform X1 [Xiphophorus couchianus]